MRTTLESVYVLELSEHDDKFVEQSERPSITINFSIKNDLHAALG